MFYRPLRDEASVRKESETERMVWQICIIFIAMKAAIFQTMVIRSWYLEESGARKKRQEKSMIESGTSNLNMKLEQK